MKKLTMLLIALFIAIGLHGYGPPTCSMSHAQEVPQPAQDKTSQSSDAQRAQEGLSIPFSVGQDNAYLCQNGNCFFAVGGGVDIVGFEKAMGSNGSILDLKLHGMMLSKVTDNESGTLTGAAITLDVMKLITGAKLSVLIDNLSFLVGPAVAYDVGKGGLAYGGMVNLNYAF